MGESLNYELMDRIDVLSYAPAAVSTKMIGSKSSNNENLQGLITTDRAAEVCLRDLGFEPRTHGARRHEHVMNLLNTVPRFLLNKYSMQYAVSTHKKIRAKEARVSSEKKDN